MMIEKIQVLGRVRNPIARLLVGISLAISIATARNAAADDGMATGEAINKPPLISGFDADVAYTENALPVILDANATISDSDSANFDGGNLVVRLIHNTTATDLLGIRNQGIGANEIAFDGENVKYGGVVIGTTRRPSRRELIVHFDANATVPAATALLRNLIYIDTSENPRTFAREVVVQVSDGDLGLNDGYSNKQSKNIQVIPANDPPVISNLGAPVVYFAKGPAVPIAPNAEIDDVDTRVLIGGKLTIEITANAQATDRLRVKLSHANSSWSAVGGNGQIPLEITQLTYPQDISIILQHVEWSCDTDKPSIQPRTISIKLTDGEGGESILYRKRIFVVR